MRTTTITSGLCRKLILTGLVLVIGRGAGIVHAADPGGSFGPIEIPRAVYANGAVLAPGSYTLRITTELSDGERWVEFQSRSQVAGRELATVIAEEQINTIAKLRPPQPGLVRVDTLKGGEFFRVWINDAGTHYLIHLPLIR